MENGYYTRNEIHSQPEAWADALTILESSRQDVLGLEPGRLFDQMIFTGCGSTYYLALAAAALCQQVTHISCRAFPASELWLYPSSSYTAQKTLFVAISRSGETSETLRACEAFRRDQRGALLTLSCYEQAPLAKMGDVNILLPSGKEQSVAQTRAFSTLYLGAVALALFWAGEAEKFSQLNLLPQAGRKVIERAAELALEIAPDPSIDRFYWLGSGPRYGLAAELSLKMKEMSLSHSEPFHFLEFRHGPKSMLGESSLVIGLAGSAAQAYESAVMSDLATLGARILSIGEAECRFNFQSGIDELIRNVLYLPVGQLIAFERALFKGLNPDMPNNLDAVVKLQGGEVN